MILPGISLLNILMDLLCWKDLLGEAESWMGNPGSHTFQWVLLSNKVPNSAKRQMVSVSAGQSLTFSECLKVVVLRQCTPT